MSRRNKSNKESFVGDQLKANAWLFNFSDYDRIVAAYNLAKDVDNCHIVVNITPDPIYLRIKSGFVTISLDDYDLGIRVPRSWFNAICEKYVSLKKKIKRQYLTLEEKKGVDDMLTKVIYNSDLVAVSE